MTRNVKTVAILSPGIMGAALGGALRKHGVDVVTSLSGRGADSRARAERHGLRALGSLEEIIGEAELICSVVPPAAALDQARDIAVAMGRAGKWPAYAELNAVSPDVARGIAALFEGSQATFIDGGIIGAPPPQDLTRIYVSGPDCRPMLELDGMDIVVRQVAGGVGQASALKMCFAGINKGTNALLTATMLVAEELGVAGDLVAELESCQPATLERMRRVIPRLPADSGRYVYEMEQIAETFVSAGAPDGFHQASAEIMRRLAASPFGAETRETFDRARSMEATVKALSGKVD